MHYSIIEFKFGENLENAKMRENTGLECLWISATIANYNTIVTILFKFKANWLVPV